MSDWNNTYIKLLRDQVEVEIKFLQSQGHDSDKITSPCMFCYDSQQRFHKCRRLTELRQFLSQLVVRQKSIKEIPHFDYKTSEMPLLYPDL